MSRILERQKTPEIHHSSLPWKERWSYPFDNYMAKGTPALIAGLAAIPVILIISAFIDEIIVLADS